MIATLVPIEILFNKKIYYKKHPFIQTTLLMKIIMSKILFKMDGCYRLNKLNFNFT